ncbi:ribosome recycling factor domain-containing protein [Dunaliella salina]|uniref:Ribosome-recycling factor, chloroplastic n=1 Tax=Dunaliella salina TaxID=3046 RepID=A0ABQ7GNE0_DUNSA|nr:ribosome recycling factor domain-containing protein [Dunaliella salina]|eukprot:KAF5836136.1 ribosome recycling factor domain-containing protein [Dunaliella salina]
MYLRHLARCSLARLLRAASNHDGLPPWQHAQISKVCWIEQDRRWWASAAYLPASITASSKANGVSQKQLWPWPPSQLTTAGFSKKGKKGKGASDEDEGEAVEEEFSLKPYSKLMDDAIHHLQAAFGKIHTGRASPGLLEPLEVHAHNERLPLYNFATVTVRNAQLLVANVYNAEDVEPVCTAIRHSPLKLQPRVEGKEVQVPVPRPTLDGLNAMMKLVRQEAEKAKTSVRSVRHKALEAVRKEFRAADNRKRAEKEVQKLHDVSIETVEKLRGLKNKELEASH